MILRAFNQMENQIEKVIIFLYCLALITVAGCNLDNGPSLNDGRSVLKVVATTTLIADVASEIGGNQVSLSVLLPPGSDPHSYEPVPQDLALLDSAELVLINGLGFEASLEPYFNDLGEKSVIVSVSDGISPIFSVGEESVDETHENADPHVWLDPANVIVWTDNIESVFSALDPENTDQYRANASAYRQKLLELDSWIEFQVSLIPRDHRLLVTDHDSLGYFASRYDFEIVGTVIPATSTLAEPSAQGLVRLAEEIESRAVRALFVGPEVNASLAEQVAAESGIPIIILRTASLSAPGEEAGNYLDFMRANTRAIIDALLERSG